MSFDQIKSDLDTKVNNSETINADDGLRIVDEIQRLGKINRSEASNNFVEELGSDENARNALNASVKAMDKEMVIAYFAHDKQDDDGLPISYFKDKDIQPKLTYDEVGCLACLHLMNQGNGNEDALKKDDGFKTNILNLFTDSDDQIDDLATPTDDQIDDLATPTDDQIDDLATPTDDQIDDLATPTDDQIDDLATPTDDQIDDLATPTDDHNNAPSISETNDGQKVLLINGKEIPLTPKRDDVDGGFYDGIIDGEEKIIYEEAGEVQIHPKYRTCDLGFGEFKLKAVGRQVLREVGGNVVTPGISIAYTFEDEKAPLYNDGLFIFNKLDSGEVEIWSNTSQDDTGEFTLNKREEAGDSEDKLRYKLIDTRVSNE